MKTFILKITIIFLLLSITGTGCVKEQQENDALWEISPDSKNTIIKNEVNGIEFEFCLLNEKGEPATKFMEGENFKFHFKFTNNSGKDLYFLPAFGYYYAINGFCRVMSINSEDKGTPFKIGNVLDTGIGDYPFNSKEAILFEVDWADQREGFWDWGRATYESLHLAALPKGKYYTQFSDQFRFEGSGVTVIDIKDINFRINFEIN